MNYIGNMQDILWHNMKTISVFHADYDKTPPHNDIYIDDIKIIPHEHNYKKISSSLSVKETVLPINIFSEELSSAWGISNDYCGNIKLSSDLSYPSGRFIDIDIDKDKCNWKEFGISWNEWLYTDLSSSIYGVYLEFDIKLVEYQDTKILILILKQDIMDYSKIHRYVKVNKIEKRKKDQKNYINKQEILLMD